MTLQQTHAVSQVQWGGASGRRYAYEVHPLGKSFRSVPGNYIFAKVVSNQWVPVYIGQTSDLSERFENHHKMPCILSKRATHIHVHESSRIEYERLQEEADLLHANRSAYQPTGCNG